MKVVVGLGNPGLEYENTRHNSGFIAIDNISKKMQIEVNKKKFNALVGEGNYNGEKLILVKPQTYMNLSGESVKQIVDFYKLNLSDLIVIYDDIDLKLGNIRIKPSGSPGTHNGMRNITSLLGSEEFIRVRIGIGKPPEYITLMDYVLMKFSKEEKEIIEKTADTVYNALEVIINQGVKNAMNLYNGNK